MDSLRPAIVPAKRSTAERGQNEIGLNGAGWSPIATKEQSLDTMNSRS
ncbi:hypothetical protein [Desulfoferrobacter suflitae]|nr:hypothetical protein [Desulfoferrobacter suflitae]MCK8601483.1 hypothetical protein [Desulfoferrobacter suflitae]